MTLLTPSWCFYTWLENRLHFSFGICKVTYPSVTPVCNFQSMKSSVELNNLFIKILLLYHLVCYITWSDGILGDFQKIPLLQILLFFRNESLAVLKLQTNSLEYAKNSSRKWRTPVFCGNKCNLQDKWFSFDNSKTGKQIKVSFFYFLFFKEFLFLFFKEFC